MSGTAMNPVDLDYYRSFMEESADPAKTLEEIRDLLKHIRPDEELTPEQKDHVPEGLKLKLLPHQALGTAWLKKMVRLASRLLETVRR
jgi:hypothetical protein